MCVMAVVGAAPCQCFSPGGNQITSPGRISSIAPPQRCARPQPAVTIRVWPNGWVCHAVRALGSNVTLAATTRAGAGALNNGSIRTVPVKYSAGPLPEGWEPILLIQLSAFKSVEVIERSPPQTAQLPDGLYLDFVDFVTLGGGSEARWWLVRQLQSQLFNEQLGV